MDVYNLADRTHHTVTVVDYANAQAAADKADQLRALLGSDRCDRAPAALLGSGALGHQPTQQRFNHDANTQHVVVAQNAPLRG